jgi:hypothetical protein
MKRQRFELALERLSHGDWQRFEKFSSGFLVSEYPNLRTVASASGDQGRDAEVFSPTGDPGILLQYSVSQDWNTKVLQTAQRISKTFPKANMLIYCTNQKIGAKADKLKVALHRDFNLTLDIRDHSWFADRINLDANHEATAEALAADIVDPYLASREIVEKKGQALSSIEARAALVYLGLQWEDDSRDKGLTKLSFDALVRAALRDTDAEHRLPRTEIQKRVRSFLPTHLEADVNRHTDSALARLNKHFIRHWQTEDEFCLAHAEKQRLNERFAVLEKEDLALQEEILQRLHDKLLSLKQKADQSCEKDITQRVRRVLEKFLLNRGELFASAVNRGNFHDLGFDELTDIAIGDLKANPPPRAIQQFVLNVVKDIVTNILIAPGVATESYLRTLADSYTLMAFLRETPDVQSAVSKMFSHGELWLDTTVILPLFAETLVDTENQKFTGMLKAAIESGLTLRVTPGVIEEVERHMNRCMVFMRSIGSWKGRVPFLYVRYISSGRSPAAFPSWLETFAGRSRPEDDIAEHLEQTFGIKRESLEVVVNSTPDALRIAVKEEWVTIHERRRSENLADLDHITLLRLVDHDVENYIGVIGLRREEVALSPFGYKHWFLTLDHTAYQIETRLRERLGGKVPASPILSADFLVNYLAFGPVRNRISKHRESSLPILLEKDIGEYLPPDILKIAQSVRDDSKDLPELVIRRRVRDKLDEAKRRLGPIASAGMEGSDN